MKYDSLRGMCNAMLQNHRGLTLIEILGAMTILGIVVILFISVSNFTVTGSVKNDKTYNALVLAENELKSIVYTTNQTNLIVGSLQDPPKSIDGYTVYYDETSVLGTPNPSTPTNSSTQVSVVAIVNLYADTNPNTLPVQRLITVTVSWGG